MSAEEVCAGDSWEVDVTIGNIANLSVTVGGTLTFDYTTSSNPDGTTTIKVSGSASVGHVGDLIEIKEDGTVLAEAKVIDCP